MVPTKDGFVRCGWSHVPPTADSDYDWGNKKVIKSDIEDWKPDGSGEKKDISSEIWKGDSYLWFIYWMQNIPGANNGLMFKGKKRCPVQQGGEDIVISGIGTKGEDKRQSVVSADVQAVCVNPGEMQHIAMRLDDSLPRDRDADEQLLNGSPRCRCGRTGSPLRCEKTSRFPM
jgi:hypothetical protein